MGRNFCLLLGIMIVFIGSMLVPIIVATAIFGEEVGFWIGWGGWILAIMLITAWKMSDPYA
jgi:uncharacterized membrane protein